MAGTLGEHGPGADSRSGTAQVISASSLGTVFEWYDFFLYGSLASHIAAHFFSGVDETTGFIFALATFAVGFVVRPVGALVFGRIGDRSGRKKSFLITLTLMGVSTFFVGLLPGYDAIGIAAPVALVALRMVQGLAIGGEYGGAIIYVAEHAPAGRRGLHTSWIPATAVAGLLLSLAVILATRLLLTPEDFAARGWRVPFLLSVVLLGISLWIRLRLPESPVFNRMKREQRLSRAPLREAFLDGGNARLIAAALLGAVMGQAVTYYTSTFYALFFLERIARLDPAGVTGLVGGALALGIPLVLGAGWLGDRLGRKPVLLAGLGLAALLYFPLFGALLEAANPALAGAHRAAPVVVRAAPGGCSLQFDPVGRRQVQGRACDLVKSLLAREGVSHSSEYTAAPGEAALVVGGRVLAAPAERLLAGAGGAAVAARFEAKARSALAAAGYGAAAEPSAAGRLRIVAILVALLAIGALCNGAYGVMLVELFPARIRYSAVSFAQNVGNGWFGGLLPAIAFTIVAATGDIFAGLWYPVAVAAAGFVIALFALPETRGRDIH